MQNGYIIDTLTIVEFQEIVKMVGKLIENYEGVFYRNNFKKSPFREIMDKTFALRQKHNEEKNDVMQILVEIVLNSLYGEQIGKNIEEKFAGKSEYWMLNEYDEGVRGYWKISHGNYIVKMVQSEGLEDEVKKLNTMPLHLGAFVYRLVKEL